MSNLTISVNDEIIKRARVRAIQQGTSVSAKVREFLEYYVNESEDMLKQHHRDAAVVLMRAIEAATAQTQPDASTAVPDGQQRRTLRDELYEGNFRGVRKTASKTAGRIAAKE